MKSLTDVVSGAGLRLSLASFLQMAIDPTTLPFYRATLFARGFELTGFVPPADGSDEQGVYDHALLFLAHPASQPERGAYLPRFNAIIQVTVVYQEVGTAAFA